MKILQITGLGYLAGGAEKNARIIRDELIKRGHKVKVLSSDVKGPDMFNDYEFKTIPSNFLSKIAHHLFYFRSYIATRKAIKEFKPDIIHFHTVISCSPSVFFAIRNTPAVMTIHGPEEFILKLMPWLLFPSDYKKVPFDLNNLNTVGKLHYIYYRFLQRPIYRFAIRRIRFFIAPSKYFAELIKQEVPTEKIRQIYNGINLPSAKPLTNNTKVLYVGRLEKSKGVDYLIRSFADVISKIPEANLHIVGDGSYRSDLEKLTSDLSLNRNVVFRGWLHSEQSMLDEYENASMLVIPSVWPENLPTVCIEALAVGRPVIGTNTGGIPEMIQDGQTGYIVPIKDIRALSDAILKLLKDKKTATLMSKESIISSKRFSIENFADQIESLYKEISI